MKKPSIKEEKKLLRQQRQEKEKKKNILLIIVFSIIIVFIIYLCINPVVSLSYTNEANTKYKYLVENVNITPNFRNAHLTPLGFP